MHCCAAVAVAGCGSDGGGGSGGDGGGDAVGDLGLRLVVVGAGEVVLGGGALGALGGVAGSGVGDIVVSVLASALDTVSDAARRRVRVLRRVSTGRTASLMVAVEVVARVRLVPVELMGRVVVRWCGSSLRMLHLSLIQCVENHTSSQSILQNE